MNNTKQMYDAQADSIKVEDIASIEKNRIMLSRIKRNSEMINSDQVCDNSLWIKVCHDQYGNRGEDYIDYVPEGAHDMGWLGYFIGKNDHLEMLFLRDFDNMSIDIIKPFFMGISRNKSITNLDIRIDMDIGEIFTILGPFFENNTNFDTLSIDEGQLGDDGWRLLALAIGSSKHKSLRNVSLTESNISDEALVDIITSLSMHPHLNRLELNGNRLATNGCITLATLLNCSCTELKHLELDDNEIDDEGIDALVPTLKNSNHLEALSFENNSITTTGWQHLATILEAPNSNLNGLYICGNNINDEVLKALTSSLVNNITLKTLYLNGTQSITEKGWQLLSNLLCNISSVNSTFLSNHSLCDVSGSNGNQDLLRSLLTLNKIADKKQVAMIKILKNHNINMTPFFEWEFKVLPLMINWFERASAIPRVSFIRRISRGKLSSIYQFVRAMPLLYVETYLMKELEDIKAARKQKEEELVKLEERQKSIMKRLGQQRGIPS